MLAAISSLITGFYGVHKKMRQRQAWFRLGMSIFATAFVSFTGTWGFTIVALNEQGVDPLMALLLGFAWGLIVMSASVVGLWLRSPLTKGMTIMVPRKIMEQERDQDQTFVSK